MNDEAKLCTIYGIYVLHFCAHPVPPSPPLNVFLVNLTETTALLRWEPPLNDGGRGDLVYALSYQEDGTDTIVEFGRVGNSTQGEITGMFYENIVHLYYIL